MSAVPQPLAYHRLWLALGVALVIAVIVSSLVPGGTLTLGRFPGADKLAHASAYLVLMVWFAVGLSALLLVAVGVGVYCVSIYNGLVGVKHQVEQAWSNIDVLLRQRGL